MSFNHLHVHTDMGSVLDGFGTVREYLELAKSYGHTHLALTEHGTMHSVNELFELAPEYGIQPIAGCEFYFQTDPNEKRGHINVFAMNDVGMRNLFLLHEWSYTKGIFKGKSSITFDALAHYQEGLIVSTACVANIIPKSLVRNDNATAYEWAKRFKQLLGDRFYIEIQDSTDMEQQYLNRKLIALAESLKIEYIATTDVHYPLESDYDVHDTMLCIQTKSKKYDSKRFRFPHNSYWFKKEEEMLLESISPIQRARALENTVVLCNRCHATMPKGAQPTYHNIPEGSTESRELRYLVTQQYNKKVVNTPLHSSQYVKDIQNELDVFDATGYAGYMLIVADYVKHCREAGISVGSRGSACGSKVAYITGITDIEPDKYNLLFGRFLDAHRTPDIDLDFADNNVPFRYLQQLYGESNVAKIITYGTMTAKAVLRKTLSVYNTPQPLISVISGCITDDTKSLIQAIKQSSELQRYQREMPEVFEHALRLENRVSHTGKHAGGVVVCDNLNTRAPLYTDSEDRTMRILPLDKYKCEKAGFTKMDCLGLSSLAIIDEIIESIHVGTGELLDLESIDYEDEAIYKDLCDGDINFLFQLEAQGHLVSAIQPKCFDDIALISAICRPGTCDTEEYIRRRQTQDYTIPIEQEAYMRQSEGLVVYQEQYLLMCQTYAGWDIGFADRKVRKNKKIKEDTELADKFYTDSIANGYTKEYVQPIWEMIVGIVAGGYGFNSSHCYAYSKHTYKMAWLKHYYPTYFYAGALTKAYNDDKKKALIPTYLYECKKRGIHILPPDINLSLNQFLPSSEGVRYALTSVKGLGDKALQKLLEIRPITSLSDLYERKDRSITKATLISLVKAGCFDSEGTRYDMIKKVCDLTHKLKTKPPVYPELEDDMTYEYSALGVYLQKHPMERFAFQSLQSFADNEFAMIAGIVSDVSSRFDKNGNPMAFIMIDSQYGSTKLLAFKDLWANSDIRAICTEGNTIMCKGKRSGDSMMLFEVKQIQ